jgi:ABC-type Na+ efflux pump permease subunit
MERIQRQLAAWQKQKEINDLQALADAALTAADTRTKQDAVDVLIVNQVTQTLIDSTLDSQDKVVADQDVRDQIIADQVKLVTNVNLKAPNESYSPVQESSWPPGLIAGVIGIVLILFISFASTLMSNWSFIVGSRKR